MVAPGPGLHIEEHRVFGPDSLALVTWVVPPATADTLGLWVLVCHGNAGNISLPLRQDWTRALLTEGVGVVAFDYRGYGASDDGPLHRGRAVSGRPRRVRLDAHGARHPGLADHHLRPLARLRRGHPSRR
jgi:pimeloyl-ACP methyl ester carboxylesterase